MENFANKLLQHYDQHARELPWRLTCDPYKIWLSEIMLQQTTVATVIPYFLRFLDHFPTIEELAKADLQEVLSLWQGLGYYSRARNLHKCAEVVLTEYGGIFPSTEKELLALPGIGPYTAAAIGAIAFENHATVVDGNVERVMSRLYRIEEPLPNSKKAITAKAKALTPQKRNGDYAGAIMDLGATICTPKKPNCTACPVADLCKSAFTEDAATFPRKIKKKKSPSYQGTAYCIFDKQGKIYLQKRADKGLMAQLWEVPNENWPDKENTSLADKKVEAFIKKSVFKSCGDIKHTFTHFKLTLDVQVYKTEDSLEHTFGLEELPPLPTLFHKVINKALDG